MPWLFLGVGPVTGMLSGWVGVGGGLLRAAARLPLVKSRTTQQHTFAVFPGGMAIQLSWKVRAA